MKFIIIFVSVFLLISCGGDGEDKQSIAPSSEPSIVAPPSEPSIVAPPSEPSIVAPPSEPSIVAPPSEPSIVAPPSEPSIVPPGYISINEQKKIIDPLLKIIEKRYGYTIPINKKNILIDMNYDGEIYDIVNKQDATMLNDRVISIVNEFYEKIENINLYDNKIKILDSIYFAFNTNNTAKYYDALINMRKIINNDLRDYKFNCDLSIRITKNNIYSSCFKLPSRMYIYTINKKDYSSLSSNIITLPLVNIKSGNIILKIDDDISHYLNGFDDVFVYKNDLDLTNIPDKPWVSNDKNHKILMGSSSGVGLDIVILGDGYLEQERELFDTHVESMTDTLMSYDNIKKHKELYNIHSIFKASAERGADWVGSKNGKPDYALSKELIYKNEKNTYYDAGFYDKGRSNIARSLAVNDWTAISVAKEYVPYYDQIIVLVNTPVWGGSGGQIAVAAINNKHIAIHELGHSFANLLDEYDDGRKAEAIDKECDKNICYTFNKVSWKNWFPENKNTEQTVCRYIDDSNGCNKNTIGWYEGGQYVINNRWRSTNDSIMRTTGEPFYSVNAEIWLDKLYEISGAFLVELPYIEPIDKKTRTIMNENKNITFKIKKYIPTSIITWYVNNKLQDETSDVFTFYSDKDYVVEVIVTDTTGITKNNKHSFKWHIFNDNKNKTRYKRSLLPNDHNNDDFIRLWVIDNGESLVVKDKIKVDKQRIINKCNATPHISYNKKGNEFIFCPINNKLHLTSHSYGTSIGNIYDIIIPMMDYIDFNVVSEKDGYVRNERVYIN